MSCAVPPSQADVFALLSDPATHGGQDVQRIDTHISAIFIAGDTVYKLKRDVWLPFLDFTGLDQRHRACLAEVEINRRTAPDLYLGVAAVTREVDGRLTLDGQGQAVDWVVKMRRFDQDTLFDRLAAAGALTRAHAIDLADAVARFHQGAETRPTWGGAEGLRHTIVTNDQCFHQHIPDLFDADLAAEVTEGSLSWLENLTPLLDRRRENGMVRLCHGDLHLGNICLQDGKPTLFDGIEFCDDFACIDVFYDLAFLLMDFQARGLADMASWVLNRYLEQTGDLEGLAALPLMLSLRAAIRAHVSAAIAKVEPDPKWGRAATDYLRRAFDYLHPQPPRLLAAGGLSGSGKSRLARDIAPLVGAAPGAVVLRTDVIRKRLMGVAPETRLPPEGYTPEMTERTYQALYQQAAQALASGHGVIADAVFARPEQRAAIEAVARDAGTPFDGLWLEADAETMRQRVAARRNNASDATVAVLDQQLDYDLGAMTWNRIDSSGSKEDTFANARIAVHL